MTDIAQFKTFTKGTSAQMSLGTNCVIYTRVSSSEQQKGYSLDFQLEENKELAHKRNLTILGLFGGSFESASTDERSEFNRMLTFIKQSKTPITYIIVHAMDRFSRTGANALYIKEQLREQGIYILSVLFATDSTTIEGDCQQNTQILQSYNENQLRRARCMKGTKAALERGEWPTMPPLGYSIIREGGKRSIVVNAKGKLLKKAFYWKAEGVSIEHIRVRLSELGIKLCHQRVAEILRNPFYAGVIVHNMLEGRAVPGNHEKMIPHDLFLRVNEVLKQNTHGYKIKEENDIVPLKRFILCDTCGKPLRAYIVRKKDLWYYKCTNRGICFTNKSAKDMHRVFMDILACFTIPSEVIDLITTQMIATFNQLSAGIEDEASALESQIREIDKKLARLEERFVEEDMTKDLYLKYSEKYRTEKAEIEKSLTASGSKISNLDECVEKAIAYCRNLPSLWASAGYATKQQIQFLLFPEGIRFNKQKEHYLTPRINAVFASIARLSQDFSQQKSGIPQLELSHAALVVSPRIELGSNV